MASGREDFSVAREGRENWEYTFFVDVLVHRDAEVMQQALEKAREHCVSLRVVGSYPRAQNVL